MPAVREGLAAGAFDQHRGAAGDAVDAAVIGRAVEIEADLVAHPDVEGNGSLLAGCDQVVRDALVGEDPPRQGMEILGRAA